MDQREIRTERDYYELKNPSGNFFFPKPSDAKRSPQLELLRTYVRTQVSEGLRQSIHQLSSAESIDINRVFQPSLVEPWVRTLPLLEQISDPIPLNSTVLDIFEQDRVAQQLLLLGLPGSGKTITMLELADALLQRCKNSVHAPIPVILDLGSWKKPESIFNWVVQEIISTYGKFQPSLIKEGLKQHSLLPLLDGLDKVDPALQVKCVKAINHWLNKSDPKLRPVGVVVCCRIEEYKSFQHLLEVNMAVELQPLKEQQIQNYLAQFTTNELQLSLQQRPYILNSLKSPLLLSTLGYIATTERITSIFWPSMDTNQAQKYLFKKYLNVNMSRTLIVKQGNIKKIKSHTYGKKKIKSHTYGRKDPPKEDKVYFYMHVLAKILQEQRSTEFILESLSIKDLPSLRKSHYHYETVYKIIFIGLCAVLSGGFALLYSAYLSFIQPDVKPASVATTILIFTSLFILFGILLGSLAFPVRVRLFQQLRFSMRRFRINFKRTMWCVTFVGTVFIITLPIIYNAPVGGMVIGMTAAICMWVIPSVARGFEAPVLQPRRADQASRNTILFLMFSSIISFAFVLGLSIPMRRLLLRICSPNEADFTIIISSIIILASVLAFSGAIALLKYLSLRLTLFWCKLAPFRYISLLDYAVERRILQRIGGRYRFMHQLLQEHFLEMFDV